MSLSSDFAENRRHATHHAPAGSRSASGAALPLALAAPRTHVPQADNAQKRQPTTHGVQRPPHTTPKEQKASSGSCHDLADHHAGTSTTTSSTSSSVYVILVPTSPATPTPHTQDQTQDALTFAYQPVAHPPAPPADPTALALRGRSPQKSRLNSSAEARWPLRPLVDVRVGSTTVEADPSVMAVATSLCASGYTYACGYIPIPMIY